MRTIKFRAKKATNDVWVYGSLIYSNDLNTAIFSQGDGSVNSMDWAYVNSETIGQFTGLFDKNGKEIYDGDILRFPAKYEYEKENFVAFEVFWHDNDCAQNHIGWQMNRLHFQGCICGYSGLETFLPKWTSRMEIIGNIHDNPELINK